MNFPRPVITREHGSWAVLFVPMIAAVFSAGHYSSNNLFLALSALGIFMSYVPIQTILRDWTGMAQGKEKLHASYLWGAVYLALGVFFILPLLRQGYFHLLTLAVLSAGSFFCNVLLTSNGKKSAVSDLTAIAGLTMSAPAAYYVSTGLLDAKAMILWLFNVLFFGSSVLYVHMKISILALKKEILPVNERLMLGRMNILYHLFVVCIVGMLVFMNLTPALSLLAFIPMVVHALYGTFRPGGVVRFKKLGVLLLAQSIIFCVLLVLAWS